MVQRLSSDRCRGAKDGQRRHAFLFINRAGSIDDGNIARGISQHAASPYAQLRPQPNGDARCLRLHPEPAQGALTEARHVRLSIGNRVQRASAPANAHTTVPNSFPIAAASAMANAPQKVTRAVARQILAPPVQAPMAPKRARKSNDASGTVRTSILAGVTTAMSSGIAAPAEHVAAEVIAACTGRAVVIWEMPNSSRACAPRASFAISC